MNVSIGAGLGLSAWFVVVNVAQALGGEIRVEAAEGGGTCVVFALPAPPSSPSASGPRGVERATV